MHRHSRPIGAPAARVPAADVSAARVPAARVPAARVLAAVVSAAKVPSVNVPVARVPVAEVPATNVPVVNIPAANIPAADVPAAKVTSASVPVVNVNKPGSRSQSTLESGGPRRTRRVVAVRGKLEVGPRIDEESEGEREEDTRKALGYGSAGRTRTNIRLTCSPEQRPYGTTLPGF